MTVGKNLIRWAVLFGVVFAITGSAYAQISEPYHEVENWAKLPTGRTKWGHPIGIGTDSHGNVWIFDRCGGLNCVGSKLDPILEFDPSGKLAKSFGAGMFPYPTGLFVDKNDHDNIWVTERGGEGGEGYQVFKLSPEGKVLLTLGKAGVSADRPDTFIGPESVVVAPNGDIFVTDGHLDLMEGHTPPGEDTATHVHSVGVTSSTLNSRVVKFSKDGKFIKAWGKEGSGPGEFHSIRPIAIDSKGRLFVGDRGNNRIQIFDQNGKFLKEWRQFSAPSGIYIDAHDTIYVADGTTTEKTNPGFKQGIRIGSAKDGVVTAFIPPFGPVDKPTGATVGVAVDPSGNLFEVEGHMMSFRKYVKNYVAPEAQPAGT
jgi:streptogramin lyase